MKVILKQDVKKVGKKGEIVDVSDGYARNFLLARGLAVSVTEKSMEILSQQKEEAAAIEAQKEKEAKELAERLKTIPLQFRVKVGKEGQIFGSVSTKQIVEELAKKDIRVDKRKILDTAPIQSLGFTNVRIELYKNVIGTIRCELKGDES